MFVDRLSEACRRMLPRVLDLERGVRSYDVSVGHMARKDGQHLTAAPGTVTAADDKVLAFIRKLNPAEDTYSLQVHLLMVQFIMLCYVCREDPDDPASSNIGSLRSDLQQGPCLLRILVVMVWCVGLLGSHRS